MRQCKLVHLNHANLFLGDPLQSDQPAEKSLSCHGLMKVRAIWSTVDPMQAPLDVGPKIQGLFVSLDKLNGLVE